MKHEDLTNLTLFGEYDQPTLAALWGYKSYDAIRRGIVTPSGEDIIILFVTENKDPYATQYSDKLEGSTLYMSGENGHGNDKRLLRNLDDDIDTIYLFYRTIHHTPFIYYGPVKLKKAEEKISEPSHFEFEVNSLLAGNPVVIEVVEKNIVKEGNNMNFFGLKISNPKATDIVQASKDCSEYIEIEQLNQLDESLKKGEMVFISLGGDKVSWDKGLIGLAEIVKEPFDKGYDPENKRNFKLGLKMIFALPEVMKRSEFIYYPNAYDAAGIGPNTKGEQNQAIKALEKKQAVSILRAIVDKYPEVLDKIKNVLAEEIIAEILGVLPVLIQKNLAFGEKEKMPRKSYENESDRIEGGENILLYGVPGCGKSHTIKKEYCSDNRFMERIVFHPDYTYTDFAGQILPKANKETKQIEYIFSPGPFARILKKAFENKGDMYYLVIEELNRGNAPAIFGDIFQLLDRKESGESEYKITNKDIALEVFGDETAEIYLPSNLTVLATMNTSDQNIFTLDTAFKRRWKMRMIKNDIDGSELAHVKIMDTEVEWGKFAKEINKIILSENSESMSTEDKRIGAYFVEERDLKLKNDEYNPAFAEKVLMYLWNDVFKYNREVVFKEQFTSLEDLVDGFEREKFEVFNISFSG